METIKIVTKNKSIYHDYEVLEELECGIVLTGTEIKSIRDNKVSIEDSYIACKGNIMYIYNMHIAKYSLGTLFNHDEKRDRVLLLHKKEIRKFSQKVKLDGLTIIPIMVYFKDGLCKVKIGLCRGKKKFDKRQDMKKNDAIKEINRLSKRR